MVANDVQPGLSITYNWWTLSSRWAVDVGDFRFLRLAAFYMESGAKAYLFFFFLHAFTKANDTPMDNYDTPGEEDTVVYSGICGFFTAFWVGN